MKHTKKTHKFVPNKYKIFKEYRNKTFIRKICKVCGLIKKVLTHYGLAKIQSSAFNKFSKKLEDINCQPNPFFKAFKKTEIMTGIKTGMKR